MLKEKKKKNEERTGELGQWSDCNVNQTLRDRRMDGHVLDCHAV